MIALLLLLQAAAPAAASAPPERFSILVEPPPAPCRVRLPDDDVVVCGNAAPSQRLPLPTESRPPDRPMASNPDLNGTGALRAAGAPCATLQGGCQTGVDVFGAGTAAVRLVQKLVAPDSCCEEPGEATNPFKLIGDVIGGAKRAAKGKPDKTNRVAIDLSAPPPTTARATP